MTEFSCAAVLVLQLSWLGVGAGISEDNFSRIKSGMRSEEVEKILCGPPGIRTSRLLSIEKVEIPLDAEGKEVKSWIGDLGIITLEFNCEGVVLSKRFSRVKWGESKPYDSFLKVTKIP